MSCHLRERCVEADTAATMQRIIKEGGRGLTACCTTYTSIGDGRREYCRCCYQDADTGGEAVLRPPWPAGMTEEQVGQAIEADAGVIPDGSIMAEMAWIEDGEPHIELAPVTPLGSVAFLWTHEGDPAWEEISGEIDGVGIRHKATGLTLRVFNP